MAIRGEDLTKQQAEATLLQALINLEPDAINKRVKALNEDEVPEFIDTPQFWQHWYHQSTSQSANLARSAFPLFSLAPGIEYAMQQFFCRSIALLDKLLTYVDDGTLKQLSSAERDSLNKELSELDSAAFSRIKEAETVHFRQSINGLGRYWPILTILPAAQLLLNFQKDSTFNRQHCVDVMQALCLMHNHSDAQSAQLKQLMQSLFHGLRQAWDSLMPPKSTFLDSILGATACIKAGELSQGIALFSRGEARTLLQLKVDELTAQMPASGLVMVKS